MSKLLGKVRELDAQDNGPLSRGERPTDECLNEIVARARGLVPYEIGVIEWDEPDGWREQ